MSFFKPFTKMTSNDMRTEIRAIGQNMMNQIIKLLNIRRNYDCLFEMEELTIEVVLLVTLKAAIVGRAKIKTRGPLKDGFYRLRPKDYGTHKVHYI